MTQEIILVSGLFVLGLIVLGWLWRGHRKRAAARAVERMPITMVEHPTETDKRAYSLLREHRGEVWSQWGDEMPLSPQVLYEISFDAVRRVAAVYYPEEKDPHYKATVEGLMDLNSRIVVRVKDLLDKPILNKLRGLDVATIITLKKGYDVVWKNPLVEFIKKPKIRQTVKSVIDAVNIFNPWHWARKVVIEAGLETAKRYFVTGLVTIVGEEAVLLFSGRNIRNEKAAADLLILYEMVHTLHEQKSISAEEYEVLLRRLQKLKHLDSRTKLEVLGILAGKRKMAEQDISDLIGGKEATRMIRALEELAEANGPAMKAKARRIERLKGKLLQASAKEK